MYHTKQCTICELAFDATLINAEGLCIQCQKDVDKTQPKLKDCKCGASISINLTAEDLEDLQNGEQFNWRFGDVDVHLHNKEEEDDEE